MPETVVVDSLGYQDLWATCLHPAGPHDHRCPECKHVLRRCCDSLTGYYPHTDTCRRPTSQSIETEEMDGTA